MSPEWEVLLHTAHVEPPAASRESLRQLLRRELDWDALLNAAKAHGTTPLLYWNLSRFAADLVPAPLLESLRAWFLENARSNLRRTGELLLLLHQFAARGIRALPFKGPTLAAHAYGNLALRQFLDLDLLFTPADLPRAVEAMAEAGYSSALPLPPAQREAYLASMGQVSFFKEQGACMVELHARLAMRAFHFRLGLEELWARQRPLALGDKEVPGLADEDLLLVLCAHATRHQWLRLAWVCDVAEVVRAAPALSWQTVVARARELHAEYMLDLGLLLAHDLLHADVPDELIRRARAASAVRTLAAQASRHLTGRESDRPEGFRAALFQFRARERWRDGLGYALSLVVEPTFADWVGFRVPGSLSFLYYLWRPVRLVGKYLRRLVRPR